MCLDNFQTPTEHRSLKVENKTSGKYSSRSDKKKAKSFPLKLEANPPKGGLAIRVS